MVSGTENMFYYEERVASWIIILDREWRIDNEYYYYCVGVGRWVKQYHHAEYGIFVCVQFAFHSLVSILIYYDNSFYLLIVNNRRGRKRWKHEGD